MSIIYLESTINLLISSGEKEKVGELIKSGQVKEIVSERITERLLGMKSKDLKYYGEQKTAEELIEILNRQL